MGKEDEERKPGPNLKVPSRYLCGATEERSWKYLPNEKRTTLYDSGDF